MLRGQTQALIGLAGSVRRRGPGQDNLGGKVVGKAYFAVAAGYISEAKLKVEADGGGNGGMMQVTEVTLTRVPGNTLGVVPTPPPPVLVRGKTLISEDGDLDQASLTNNPERPGIPYKLYSPTFTAGTTYIIELNKTNNQTNLDPYLILKNPQGQKVAEDDDSGGELNSRIVFRATQTGVHQIYATTLDRGQTGPFRLIITEATVAEAKKIKGR